MSPRHARLAVTIAAGLMAASGATLLFVPEAVASSAGPLPVGQLLGGALLGFAAMNWVARGAALGGIYGRAVVTGNYAHFTIGALVLLGHLSNAGAGHPAFWPVSACYLAGAVVFTWLLFFSSGLPNR